MNKYLALALATPLALTACSPDSGGGDGDSNASGDLVISSTNREVIINQSLSQFATTDELLTNPADGFSDFLITGDDSSSRTADPRAIIARIQETIACDTGSASVTANTANVDSEPLPASGSASFEANYNNCTFSSSEEGFNFLMTIDGGMSASLEWTGYVDGDPGQFDTFNMAYDVDEFSFVLDINGEKSSFEIDFEASLSFDNPTASYSYSGSFEIDEAGDGSIGVRTIDPIVMEINARPKSGKVIMEGGGGTSITYTVEADGIDVSVNGGQAKLYVWSDIDSLE